MVLNALLLAFQLRINAMLQGYVTDSLLFYKIIQKANGTIISFVHSQSVTYI